MADNLQILINAILSLKDITASKNEIKKGLPKLSSQLVADKSARVDIVAGLDLSKTKKLISSQLTTLSKELKLNIANVTASATKNVVNNATRTTAVKTPSVSNDTNIKNITTEYKNLSSAVEIAKKEFAQLENVSNVSSNFTTNVSRNIDGFVVKVEKANGAIENFKYKLEDNNVGTKSFFFKGTTGSDSGIVKTLQKASKEADKCKNKLESLKRDYKDVNNARAIQNTSSLDTQYNVAIEAVEKLKVSSKDTFDSMKNNADAEIQKLKDMTVQIRNAEYASSSLRGKDITTVKIDESNKLKQFIAEVEGSKVPIKQMQATIDNLEVSLSSIGGDKTKLVAYQNEFSNAESAFKAFKAEVTSNNAFEKQRQQTEAYKVNIQKLGNEMKSFANTNQKAMQYLKVGSNNLTMAEQLKDLQLQLSLCKNPADYKKVAANFRLLKSEVKSLDLQGNTFLGNAWEKIKKFSGWMGMTAIIAGSVRQVKNMITNVIELDSAMVNLKKVTDETDVTYSNFLDNACDKAKELHSTVSDLIEQTATWSKLGFELSDASKLAEISMKYSKVGEVDNDTAVTNIVTSLKSFYAESKNAEEAATHISDVYNALGNSFAVSSNNLGSGMAEAAATMSMFGNTFNQTAALLTGAGEILGDNKLEEIGTGLKIVTLRLQNQAGVLQDLGEEYEDLESVSKTQQQIYKLTQGQVNIMSDADPTKFKNTYEILKETSAVIDKLSETDRSSLIQLMFGKNRANVGVSVLQAFKSGQIDKAYETAVNSAGSMQNEYDKLSNSIEAHINTFKAGFETLSKSVVDSDFLKKLIDVGTSFLDILDNIVNKIGLLPTLIGSVFSAISITKSFKDTGGSKIDGITLFGQKIKGVKQEIENIDYTGLQKFNEELLNGANDSKALEKALLNCNNETQDSAKALIELNNQRKAGMITSEQYATKVSALTQVHQKLTVAQKASAFATKAMSVALSAAFSVGITLLIAGVISWVGKLVNKEKELAEAAEEARTKAVENAKAIKEETDNLDSLVKRYTEIVATTDDLTTAKDELTSIQQELIDTYGAEADRLDLVNGKYSEMLDIINETKKAEAENYLSTNKSAYDTAKEKMSNSSEVKNVYDSRGVFLETKIDDDVTRIKLDSFDRWGDQTLKNWEDAGAKVSVVDNKRTAYLTGTLEEQLKSAKIMQEVYSQQKGYHKDRLKMIEDTIISLETEIAQYKETTKTYEEYQKYVENITLFENDKESQKKLDDIVEKVIEARHTIENSNSPAEKATAILNLDDYKEQAYALANGNKEITNSITTLFDSLDINTVAFLENLSEGFATFRDETVGSTIDAISSLKDAIQTTAEGSKISSDNFWDIADLDTDGIIKDINVVNGEYQLSTAELIELKDSLIQKSKEEAQAEVEKTKIYIANAKKELETQQILLEAERENLSKFGSVQSPADITKYNKINSEIERLTQQIKDGEASVYDYTLLIRQLNSEFGNTVDVTETVKQNISDIEDEISDLKEKKTNLVEYEKSQIEDIVSNLEAEKDVLEKENDELNKQLDTLEEQQTQIEKIISNYETVVDVVENCIDKEIEKVENNQSAIEEYYDSQIDKLKNINEERQDAINLIEKQNNLENVKNNKVRTYTESSGYVWGVNKEELENARNDLAEAKNDESIKKLEKEKEIAVSNFQKQIKSLEEYKETWENTVNSVQDNENELLAEELLGSTWREDIKNQDTKILNTFSNNYNNYQTKLKTIVSTEIATLNNSIAAKKKEIDAKEEQIESWNDYEKQLELYVDSVNNTWDNYILSLNNVTLSESSSYDDRVANLDEFVKNYTDLTNQIESKGQEIISANAAVNDSLANLSNNVSNLNISGTLQSIIDKAKETSSQLDSVFQGSTLDNIANTRKLTQDMNLELLAVNSVSSAKSIFSGNKETILNTTSDARKTINLTFNGDIVTQNPTDFEEWINSYVRKASLEY